MSDETLLTVKEVAARLRFSADTVRRLVAARELAVVRLRLGPGPVRKTRGRMYFRPEDVETFLARRRVAAATETNRPAVARAALREVMPEARRFL